MQLGHPDNSVLKTAIWGLIVDGGSMITIAAPRWLLLHRADLIDVNNPKLPFSICQLKETEILKLESQYFDIFQLMSHASREALCCENHVSVIICILTATAVCMPGFCNFVE